jgi:hypothetical protein
VIDDDEAAATQHHEDAMPLIAEAFQPETTARNLRLIQRGRTRRGAVTPWLDPIIVRLESRAAEMLPRA